MTAQVTLSEREPAGGRPTVIRLDAASRPTELAPGAFLTPRHLGRRGSAARVCLVGHQAMLLAGDHLRLEIEVAAGAHLELVEPSGLVAYHARGGRASWRARVRVGAGGSLTWRSAPFVVAQGADVERRLDLALGAGAVAALHETLVLGRHAEPGGALLAHTRVELAGAPLLVETLDLRDPAARRRPGVLGGRRVLATALVLGVPVAAEAGPLVTPLAGPGAQARALRDAAHQAERDVEASWRRWLAETAGRRGGQRGTADSPFAGGPEPGFGRDTATITGTSTEATIPAAKPLL